VTRTTRTTRLGLRTTQPGGRVPRGAALLAVVLVAVAAVIGLMRVEVDTSIDSFLPADDPAYQSLEGRARAFGGDPVIVMLESEDAGELLLGQENLMDLVKLEGQLAELPDVAAVYGPGTVLNQTAGAAQDMLAQISGRRDGLRATTENRARERGATPAEVTAAGKAAVAKFDRRYGALLVQGMPAGLPTLRNSRFVQSVIFDDDARPRARWHFIVPDGNTVAVLVRPRDDLDQTASAELVQSVRDAVDGSGIDTRRVTVTGVPVITAGLTDRAQQELPLLGALAVLLVGGIFLLVPWTRRRRSRLRPVVAALSGTALTVACFGWFDRPVSLGVVAFLPILLGIGGDYPFYLSRPGPRRTIIVAALAGCAGFASLALSPLPFVRELGLSLALGIMITVGVALGMNAVLGQVPHGPAAPPRALRTWSLAQRFGLAMAAVAVAAGGWAVLPTLDVEGQPDQLARGLDELHDAEYAEQKLGSSGEVSIRIRGKDLANPEVLRWTEQVRSQVVRQHGDELRPVLTLADLYHFLGTDPTQAQVDAAMEIMPRYLTSAVLRNDQSEALMVFGVKLRDVEEIGSLLDDVEKTLPDPPTGVEADLVGLPVAAARGLDLVSEGRTWMNIVGIGLALLVVLIGLRSARDTGRVLFTVLLAAGWVSGLVYLTAGSLSPLTVAIGSLTTATGCEFALMLARSGHRDVLRNVGTAALAATAGYLVLGLSELAVLRDFGLLLGASVACSFLAAVVANRVLPDQPRAPELPAAEMAGRPVIVKEVALT
jgi:predicted RND superfamily exporter protein